MISLPIISGPTESTERTTSRLKQEEGGTMGKFADALFYNGRIFTFDRKMKNAEAIAVRDGMIVAVGSNVEARAEAPAACDKLNLEERIVIPGFIDSHTHFLQMGLDRYSADLSGVRSLKEALALLASVAKRTPEGQWVIGTNWAEGAWPDGRYITKADLDNCCPKHPVVAYRVCLHLCSVNSRAIEQAGIDKHTPGAVTTPSGKLTGVMKESALGVVYDAIPMSEEMRLKVLFSAVKRAHSVGVTSIHDNGDVGAAYNGGTGNLRTYQTAERMGKLLVRVRFNTPSSDLDHLLKLNISSGLGSEWLSLGGLKVFCDGGIGARTAALSEPYADDPGNKGVFVHDKKNLDDIVARASEGNIQLVIHAIGDMGIEAAISSIEKALDKVPRYNHRHRIEHLSLPSPEHLKRMRRLGLIASMQPNFVAPFTGVGGMYQERLGPERARRNNPLADVLRARIRMAFGSDCMPMAPLLGIMCAANAAHSSQRITVKQATAAYTVDAAYAGFDETRKGTISVGKVADFVVLSNDPFVNPRNVQSTKVVQTVVAGRVVFDAAKRAGTK
jgi:predicted amidohydrolase YtcJ